ncbi:MAG: mitochondrial fission ELM1 family protein [Methylovirgula sp.]
MTSEPIAENATQSAALPPQTRLWILSDGKIGDEVQCLGIAEALGLNPELRHIAPRRTYAWAMPYGPIDPREAPQYTGSPLAPPFPDIAIAAGRRTVPYLRALKAASQGKTFTVFVKDPYWSRRAMDLIVVPEHDRLHGANIFATLTPANRLHGERLAAARATVDPRIAGLPRPRVALILGGDSQHHRFEANDIAAIVAIARTILDAGESLMVTPSRRTPPLLIEALTTAFGQLPDAQRQNIFLWTGQEPNPYLAIIAAADAIVVTGDSVNMVGEAVASGAPVHVYEPSGGHKKITAYLDRLEALGAIRRWHGALEDWRYAPINATPLIAAEIARRYLQFRR